MSFARCLSAVSVLFLIAAAVYAQENPLNYGNIVIEGCGKVGALLSQNAGTGERNGRTTKYLSAAFEIQCEDSHVGQIDIQTADNEAAVVTSRPHKGQPESQAASGSDVSSLVTDGIRFACSCSAN